MVLALTALLATFWNLPCSRAQSSEYQWAIAKSFAAPQADGCDGPAGRIVATRLNLCSNDVGMASLAFCNETYFTYLLWSGPHCSSHLAAAYYTPVGCSYSSYYNANISTTCVSSFELSSLPSGSYVEARFTRPKCSGQLAQVAATPPSVCFQRESMTCVNNTATTNYYSDPSCTHRSIPPTRGQADSCIDIMQYECLP